MCRRRPHHILQRIGGNSWRKGSVLPRADQPAAIVGLGNCGSCTGWTIHDALAAAATGIPTIAICTRNFDELGHTLARRGGRSGLRIHILPHPLNEREQGDVESVARAHYAPMLEAFGATISAREAAE